MRGEGQEVSKLIFVFFTHMGTTMETISSIAHMAQFDVGFGCTCFTRNGATSGRTLTQRRRDSGGLDESSYRDPLVSITLTTHETATISRYAA